jgi:non-specific serine/threonine protein kinase
MTRLYRGRYEPLELAGRGGQGEVWRALDHVHQRPVALKIRRGGRKGSQGRETLLREARTLLAMRPHPSLPLVRDDFFVGDRYVIVMDWIEGTNLADAGDLPYEDVLGYLEEVAEALDHLHAHVPPILHRDVKPANILVTPQGRAVLVDFGLAGTDGGYAGTPAYVAPELAMGGEISRAADVFGLAVTALAVLTGAPPEPGREPDWTRVPSAMREQLRRVLGEALAVDPRLRPPTAGALVASMRPQAAPTNLPAELTTFVGRERAMAELRRLVSSTRLLTLTGPGGAGKTRLAIRLAQAARTTTHGGVWLAELAGLGKPTLVAHRVAAALGVRSERARDVLDSLVSFFGSLPHLLVLDNCEHVVESCAQFAEDLLRACPALTIVATSRDPLRASGEKVWVVPSLSTDEAVRLFADRSSADDTDQQKIARVCERLDGIPLAVELAAARSATISLDELADSLGDALGVLTGGARTLPRHETLRATIDWSHELLADDDRTALRRLSVFAGGFTDEAAQDVCDVRSVDRLMQASLLSVAAGARHRMLDTVRSYAAEKLEAAGEASEIRARHARCILELAERTAARPRAAQHEALSPEHENISAALRYAIHDDPQTAARIACLVWNYWHRGGHWGEGRSWLDALSSDPNALPPVLRAELLRYAGAMAHFQGDSTSARDTFQAALELSETIGDQKGAAECLNGLALEAHARGDVTVAKSLLERSVAISREAGHRSQVALSLYNLAGVVWGLGDGTSARAHLEESLAIRRELGEFGEPAALADHLIGLGVILSESGDAAAARPVLEEAVTILRGLGDDYRCAATLVNLGGAVMRVGGHDDAHAHFTEAHEIFVRLGHRIGIAFSLHGLAEVARVTGALDLSAELHAEAIEIRRELGDTVHEAESVRGMARLAADRGDLMEAVRLLGEAEARRELTSTPLTPVERLEVDQLMARAREALGADGFDRTWAEGLARAAR